ncbi:MULTISPECIES: tol-pal system protein YbgF [Shewanella]|uniref:Cell division coordinator CpoB n=1 Tax=Shewanella marisflavi TaxID=260364 RepID=A0AAC9XNS4_9GAMM|nr:MULTISPECIES: tol-pal system protein YbgF [Shewanella]ASJ97195.1 tol-pal system protein YbgF [Shewanella marisflavi]MCL1043566.1 tol-pal system protein YbgF [Shewanella marisflavi]QDF75735.1 tol-pal system protein YbgF [Shewanella marisflavi]
MKTAVVTAAILMSVGVAVAAPAPVEDIAGGSPDDRVARLERIIKAKQAAEFEMQQRLDTLQQEVLDLRGLTEQQSYQINQMLQRQRQLYEDIANLSKTKTTQVAATPVNSGPASSSLGETASYERAVNLVLKERQYDEAIPAFREFIRQYPDSTYAANANYWLGQLLYNKGEFAEAAKAFDTVVNQFKDSNKRGDSLVKLGMIAQKRNDNATAKRYYQQVVSEYANSAAARIAKQQMVGL